MQIKIYEKNNKKYISIYDAYKLGLINPNIQMTEINSNLYEINIAQYLQLKNKEGIIIETYPLKANDRIDKLQENKENIVVIRSNDLTFLYPSTARNLNLITDEEYAYLKNQLYLLDINLFNYISKKFNITYINMPTEDIEKDKTLK